MPRAIAGKTCDRDLGIPDGANQGKLPKFFQRAASSTKLAISNQGCCLYAERADKAEIYSWVFGLLPMPRGKQAYLLSFHAVDDNGIDNTDFAVGALPDKALEQRRDKTRSSVGCLAAARWGHGADAARVSAASQESASVRAFRTGSLAQMRRLDQARYCDGCER
eukprot:6201010-Pleurochrysis_carterae.AAC.5